MPDPTRRPRGALEADVKIQTDRYSTGELVVEDGKPLTPYRIAQAIQEFDALDEMPSSGAVTGVLGRWEQMGFAVCNARPYAFRDYTEEARRRGLTAMREDYEERARSKARHPANGEPDMEQIHGDAPPLMAVR